MNPIVLAIPTPPSVNRAFRNVQGKGRVRSKVYTDWAKEAGWAIRAQRPGKIGGKVTLEIGVKRIANADVSNRIKCLEDLLVTLGVIDDDKNVEKVSAEWRDDITGAVVTVRAFDVPRP